MSPAQKGVPAVDVVDVPRLTLAGAQRALAAAAETATSLGCSVVVLVADPAGDPLAMARMDGAPLFSVTAAAKKAWTAAASGTRGSDICDVFGSDPTLLHALAPKVDELMAVGGATPIAMAGGVAGAIGVSGATEEQDQQIADAGAAAVAS